MARDLEVYMAAPESGRAAVRAIQDRARRMLDDARILGMPHDTFDEVAAERDREVARVVNEAIGRKR